MSRRASVRPRFERRSWGGVRGVPLVVNAALSGVGGLYAVTRSVPVVLLGCCLAALLAVATAVSAPGGHPSDPDGPA
ncbi:hypothetical protein [Phytohabitans houttuyneae]|uniref:hypothetical protein n=1 Tax=Phytohabitans houttuyneae TaxID=1076126 RepID=UPI001566771D|nr:hypothetical protein [Phytohabitans houttuyneae]